VILNFALTRPRLYHCSRLAVTFAIRDTVRVVGILASSLREVLRWSKSAHGGA